MFQLIMWGIGCLLAAAIFGPLAVALRRIPDHVSRASARTVRAMATLTLFGWTVYPFGYLQPLIGFEPDVRELVYNIADLINKAGLGAIIFWGGRMALQDARNAARNALSSASAPTTAGGLDPRSPTDRLLAGSS